MRSAAVLLSFAASAFAYQITSPSETVGWTNQGAQTVTWDRVNTDPTNFTILLTNEDRSVLPINNQALAALVDGNLLKVSVNPPSGGWPVGGSFRVNFVQDEQHPNTIYAQSSEFNITASTSSSAASSIASVSGSTTRSGTTLVVSSSTAPPASGASAGTQTSGAATTSQSSNTNPPGNGAASVRASAGLFAGLALLGAVLA